MLDDLKFMNVSDLMQGWPQTVPVFVKHHMACPGCVMAPFMTIREVAAEYGLPEDQLVQDLAEAMPQEQWDDRV